MTKSELASDIEYIKTLAAEGRNAPYVGSKIGIWWGVLVCLALFGHWTIVTGTIEAHPSKIGLIWLSMAVIGTIGSAVMGRSVARKPGASAVNNRIAHTLWTGNVILLFLFGLSAGISAGYGINSFDIMNVMVPLAFGLYGLTGFVLTRLGSEKWMIYPAIIAFALVPVSLFLLNSTHLFLVAIFGVIVTILIPDFIQLRKEPKSVV